MKKCQHPYVMSNLIAQYMKCYARSSKKHTNSSVYLTDTRVFNSYLIIEVCSWHLWQVDEWFVRRFA